MGKVNVSELLLNVVIFDGAYGSSMALTKMVSGRLLRFTFGVRRRKRHRRKGST